VHPANKDIERHTAHLATGITQNRSDHGHLRLESGDGFFVSWQYRQGGLVHHAGGRFPFALDNRLVAFVQAARDRIHVGQLERLAACEAEAERIVGPSQGNGQVRLDMNDVRGVPRLDGYPLGHGGGHPGEFVPGHLDALLGDPVKRGGFEEPLPRAGVGGAGLLAGLTVAFDGFCVFACRLPDQFEVRRVSGG